MNRRSDLTITVQVNGDREFESDETFFVNLSTPSSNAAISWGTGYGTIIDDEPQIRSDDHGPGQRRSRVRVGRDLLRQPEHPEQQRRDQLGHGLRHHYRR